MGSSKSAVDPRCCIDYYNGNAIICGAFRPGMKGEFEWSGLDIEDIIHDEKLFRLYICHNSPGRLTRFVNGRCTIHGAKQGRPMITGKYSKYLKNVDPKTIERILTSEPGKTLKPELQILQEYIGLKVAHSVEEYEPLANKELAAIVTKIEKAYETLNFELLKTGVAELKKHIDKANYVKAAQKEVVSLIETYADVMEKDKKIQVMEDQYMHKLDHVKELLLIFAVVASIIPDEHQYLKQEVKNGLLKYFRPRLGGNVPGPVGAEDIIRRFEDQEQGSATDYIEAEYSTEIIRE